MHIANILLTGNRQCNLIAAINGIFLHTCNTSERAIDAFARSDASISAASINKAVNSLSIESAQNIISKGQTMLYGYVLDNFNITLKHTTGTTDQSMSDMFHLTAGLLINLAHTSLPDLMHSSYIWERSKYNDKRTESIPDYSYHRLFELHTQTLPPGSLTYKEDFCRWQFAVDLCTHGPEYFRKFLSKIRPPETIDKIPVFKTESVPLRSMEFHNSTVEGNLSAITAALQQTRVWNLEELMESQMLPGLDETVIFFYGDLGTWERIQSAQAYRSIEDSIRERLKFLVFIPGLFHVKIACADAIHRMFIQPGGLHSGNGSMLSFIDLFYPKLRTKIINNKAGFRVSNDCITRVGGADRLECIRVYVADHFPGCKDLDDLADRDPTLQDIEYICSELATTFASSSKAREDYKYGDPEHRDHQYENTLIRIEYILLYEELAYSIRCGDVGRIETCLRSWIPIFKATGKHKYASHLLEFMIDVNFMYPDSLKKAVRYNWLCNPSGKEMGFRGVDWLQELMNLHTKVTYGGSGSNYTIERILKESPLIQTYQDCKKVVEQQYLLTPKTTRHGDPDMTNTYDAMSRLHQQSSLLKFEAGRETSYLIPNYYSLGLAKYNTEKLKGVTDTDDLLGDDLGEITLDDLAVDED